MIRTLDEQIHRCDSLLVSHLNKSLTTSFYSHKLCHLSLKQRIKKCVNNNKSVLTLTLMCFYLFYLFNYINNIHIYKIFQTQFVKQRERNKHLVQSLTFHGTEALPAVAQRRKPPDCKTGVSTQTWKDLQLWGLNVRWVGEDGEKDREWVRQQKRKREREPLVNFYGKKGNQYHTSNH